MVNLLIYTFQDIDMIDINFNELDKIVDRYIIVEYPFGSGRQPRPLYFLENKENERFKKFEHKTYHIIDDNPYTGTDGLGLFWSRKHSPYLVQKLEEIGCKDDDFIIAIDSDVVLKKSAFDNIDLSKQTSFRMNWYCYWYNAIYPNACFAWSISAPLWIVKNAGSLGHMVGYHEAGEEIQYIDNSGYHFAKCGGVDKVIENIASYPHQEFSKDPALLDPVQVQERIDNLWGWTDKSRGTDPANWEMKVLPYKAEDYPEYINNNPQIFEKYFLNGMK